VEVEDFGEEGGHHEDGAGVAINNETRALQTLFLKWAHSSTQ